MTDELQPEIDRITSELEGLQAAARTKRAEVEARLRARLADLDALALVRRHKRAELDARLKALLERNAELRRALLRRE